MALGDVLATVTKTTVKYLNDIYENENLTDFHVLKSYYGTRRLVLERRNNIASTESTKRPTRCINCCLKFAETKSKRTVKSEAKKSAFQRKLLKKNAAGKPLTRYQTAQFKKIKSHTSNKLEIDCSFCHHKTSVALKRFNRTPKIDQNKQILKENKNSSAKQKNMNSNKKKRNQDKFCGLQESAVLSATPNKSSDIIFSNNSKKKRKLKLLQVNDVSTSANISFDITQSNHKQKTMKKTSSGNPKEQEARFISFNQNSPFSTSESLSFVRKDNKAGKKSKKKNRLSNGLQENNKKSSSKSSVSTDNKNEKHDEQFSERTIKNVDKFALVKYSNISKSNKAKSKRIMKKKLLNMLNTTPERTGSTNLQQFLKSL